MGFKGKEWASISPREVRAHADALPLLTPSAFRYYFPAYLLACIDARELIDVAWDSVIFNLTPPKRRDGWQWEFFRVRAEEDPRAEAEATRAG